MGRNKKNLQQTAGHRQRLRERFLKSGFLGFQSYEIIELLLTLGTPRKDCKQVAKQIILKFKSLEGALSASFEELEKIKDMGPVKALVLKLFPAVSERLAREKITKKIKLDSPKAVADFLQKSIGKEKKEYFVMLSLNTQNQLIKVSNISVGTLDASLVHPREVFYEAIQASASQIIVAHNHPSGSTEPSVEDIEVSKQLIKTGKILGIDVLDHIIVSKNNYKSLKEADLL